MTTTRAWRCPECGKIETRGTRGVENWHYSPRCPSIPREVYVVPVAEAVRYNDWYLVIPRPEDDS